MEGVFIPSDDTDVSGLCGPIETTPSTENIFPAVRVFGPQQLPTQTLDVPVHVFVDDMNVEGVIVLDENPVEDTLTEDTVVMNKRPRRAAAVKATKTIKQVLKWERCKESSSMFKMAESEINEEFDRVHHGRVSKTHVFDQTATSSAVGVSSSSVLSTEPNAENICSDDECITMKSDMQDDDDNSDDSDDEVGSLASFVVDDEYISDDEIGDVDTERPSKKTKYESQSDSDTDDDDSCSDEDGSMELDDDSDADASIESDSDMSSDMVDITDDVVDMDTPTVEVVEIDEISTPLVEVIEPVDGTVAATGGGAAIFAPLFEDGLSPTNVENFFSGG